MTFGIAQMNGAADVLVCGFPRAGVVIDVL
jgi:hypothetical protein